MFNYSNSIQVAEFYENLKKIRKDFERIINCKNQEEIKYLKDKYEYLIYSNFDNEPFVRKHFKTLDFSRGHTLDMRKLVFPRNSLESDSIGYYQPLLIASTPKETYFYEDYPTSSDAMPVTRETIDPLYEFEEPSKDYQRSLKSDVDMKQALDTKMEQDMTQEQKAEVESSNDLSEKK